MHRLLPWVVLALTESAGATTLFVAGTDLAALDDSGRVVSAPVSLDAPAIDLEVDPSGRYVAVATAAGLSLFSPSLTPIATAAIGILDAVELGAKGDSIYVLHHPGTDRQRPGGAHTIRVSGADPPLRFRTVATLDPESFDMTLSPDGATVAVTHGVGRTLDVVRVADGTVTHHRLRDGSDRPSMGVARAAVWTSAEELLVGESARGRNLVLWRFDSRGGEVRAIDTPWRMSAVTFVADASGWLVSGTDQIARVTRSFEPGDRYELYGFATDAVTDGAGGLYTLSPSETGTRLLHWTEEGTREVAALALRVTCLARRPPGSTP